MKLPEQKSLSKKKLTAIVLAVTVLILAGLAATYVYAFNGNLFGWTTQQPQTADNTSKINYDEPTDEQKKAGEDAKKESVDGSKPNSGSDQTPAPVTQSNGKSKIDLSITAANQNGGTLQIRALISATTSSGICTLTLKNGTKTVTKTADVQSLPSNATCKGFDVPVSELAVGDWTATLHFENDSLTGDTTRGIVIQ